LGAVQSALVLGGGSDLADRLIRKLIADRCDRVVLALRDPESVTERTEAYRRLGAADVSAVGFDARNTADHAALIAKTFAEGDIDLVVCAFGVLGDQDAFDADPASAADVVAVNLAGAMSVLLSTAEAMRNQGHGTILVFSSVAGRRARADNFVYGATKAGLDAFAAGLSDRLADTGVRVVTVRPGFVSTKMTEGMTPAPFSTTADRVADDIVDGLARGSLVIWSPRILRPVFAVLTALPRPVWRKLSAR
jgi:decaprenylphospho-beta-D-erythro-pentofuranosid-2-ulose 2-reductase